MDVSLLSATRVVQIPDALSNLIHQPRRFQPRHHGVTTGLISARGGVKPVEVADIMSLVPALKICACAARTGLAQSVTGVPLYTRNLILDETTVKCWFQKQNQRLMKINPDFVMRHPSAICSTPCCIN